MANADHLGARARARARALAAGLGWTGRRAGMLFPAEWRAAREYDVLLRPFAFTRFRRFIG